MDAPLGYIPAHDASGYLALGLIIGIIFASVYWYVIHGRAWVNTNDLRAVYPNWKFTRGRRAIIGLWHGRIYIVGGKLSTFETVCDNIERIMDEVRNMEVGNVD